MVILYDDPVAWPLIIRPQWVESGHSASDGTQSALAGDRLGANSRVTRSNPSGSFFNRANTHPSHLRSGILHRECNFGRRSRAWSLVCAGPSFRPYRWIVFANDGSALHGRRGSPPLQLLSYDCGDGEPHPWGEGRPVFNPRSDGPHSGTQPKLSRRFRFWSCFCAPEHVPTQQPARTASAAGPQFRRRAGVATQPKDVDLTEAERKLQDLRRMLGQLREAIRETGVLLERAERRRSDR